MDLNLLRKNGQVEKPHGLSSPCRKLIETFGWSDPFPVDGTQFYCVLVTISPEVAYEILSGYNVSNNRNVKQTTYAKYASDMANSRWALNHQGLAFTVDGLLCDGQHRLYACVESDKSFQSLVFFDLPKQAIAEIDGGTPRRFADYLKIEGDTTTNVTWRVGVVKVAIIGGAAALTLSRAEQYELMQAFTEPLNYLLSVSKKKPMQAPVSGAIVRAYYHEDQDRLSQFVEAMQSHVVANRERDGAVASLLKYMSQNVTYGGAAQRNRLLGKATSAIYEFCREASPDKLYEKDVNRYYPLTRRVLESLTSERLLKLAGQFD